ncbi:MAG: P-loop NTPase fold protein [Candidatus Hydrogenedentales bacterium]|jgi:energy-coupling factor transporter ATP-binding protein EcfA2
MLESFTLGNHLLSSSCKTNLLSDTPATDDAFGSHERLAKVLAQMIQTEPGGKSIGIEGEWGSGKSTLVKMLARVLSERNAPDSAETTTFIFDAWAHQGDPLRRSFLAALVKHLTLQEWIPQSKWAQKLDLLNRRTENVDVQTKPKLTKSGYFAALYILFLPLGYSLFNNIDHSEIKYYSIPIWQIGLFIISIPFLVVPLMLLFTQIILPSYRWLKNRRWSPGDVSGLVYFFLQKTHESSRSTTIRTPDPTSIEFLDLFDEILTDALGSRNRSLVVVIDNLDRVSVADGLNIWSTMRTFFDNHGRTGLKWLDRLWLLVPYDRSALTRLWPNHDNSGTAPDDVAAAFASKSFQVMMRVPAPLTSDLEKYFIDQLRCALPGHAIEEEVSRIYRLYRHLSIRKHSPTPREVKLLMNKIGTLHRLWCPEIPLAFIASYVIAVDARQGANIDPIAEEFLDPVTQQLLPEGNWREFFAAMHYNVPVSKALETVLGPLVEKSLIAGESSEIKKYDKVPGLRNLIEDILHRRQHDFLRESSFMARSASAIHNILSTEQTWNSVWRWFSDNVARVSNWTLSDEGVADGLRCILAHISQARLSADADRITEAVCADPKLSDNSSQDSQLEMISTWLRGSTVFVRELSERNCIDSLREHFRVPGSPGVYLRALSTLAEMREASDILYYYQPKSGHSEVITELVNKTTEGNLSHIHIIMIDTMLKISQKWPWQRLVHVLCGRLNASNDLSPEELNACLTVLLNIDYRARKSETADALQDLVTHGHLMHHLDVVRKQPDLVSLCVYPILRYSPSGDMSGSPGRSQDGRSFYNDLLSNVVESAKITKRISTLSVEFEDAVMPLEVYGRYTGAQPLASEVFKHTTARSDVAQFISPTDVISHFEAVRALLDDASLKGLVGNLVKTSNMVEFVSQNEFDSSYRSLYLHTFETADGVQRDSLKHCYVEGLKQIAEDSWISELRAEGPLLTLLSAMLEYQITMFLGVSFHDALFKHVVNVIAGSAKPARFAGQWSQFVDALESDWQSSFEKSLWEKIINTPQSDLRTLLELYGEYLKRSKSLDHLADKLFRDVFREIAARKHESEMRWFVELLESNQDLFSTLEEATKRTFVERVRELSKSDDEHLRSCVERLLAFLSSSGMPADIADEEQLDSERRRR